ncbi:transcription elongation factor GreAB [Nonlabens spongiae]|uniref:Transcription elongation factor GreAB n=1 Tax=Nonlabens spongiae TaxID=331648 RepID=A0A1W6MHW0_9FLAO|nr:GreA/GreB family elongation factor [Nonlabens spongiae]ARN77204.1 transcription elongation factor GreAB [Nonlabens spongiae]
MKYGSLIVEKKEYVFLKRIINISGYVEDIETQKSLRRLNDELKTAQVVDEWDMPEDVIRFNSRIKVASDQGWEKNVQVVIPEDKDLQQDKISILTPMGAALFGYSEADVIEWRFPSGEQHLTIKEVMQDELNDKIEVII